MSEVINTWKEFREKYGLHDLIEIYVYARKLLEDLQLPKYASQSKLKTILQLQKLRNLLPDSEYSLKYREAIDIQVLYYTKHHTKDCIQ